MMLKNKFVFWASVVAICAGAIVGFQNQVPVKNLEKPKFTLDYVIPVIKDNPIVRSIENMSFLPSSSASVSKNISTPALVAPRTEISALAYGTYFVGSNGLLRNLLGQNLDMPLRIASITKLMTALIAIKSMNLNTVVEISQNDIGKDTYGRYKVGDRLTLKNIIYSLLIESDNDAARVISDNYGSEKFIQAMNDEAKNLGMFNTKYSNSSGVDENILSQDNFSTVSDLTKLAKYIELNYPNIFAITSLSTYKVIDALGNFHHLATSTDKLIDEFAVNYLVGGKTGNTLRAKQNLIILRAQNGDEGYYIDTVLSSVDRFGDMKLLIGKTPN